MKGDFSRDSFDPLQHYSRVLLQQGRVELDADANERQAIHLHLLRTLAADLMGPFGGPGVGFNIRDRWAASDPSSLTANFVITAGHYYVDGWLCENEEDVLFAAGDGRRQPWWDMPRDALQPGQTYLAYLDVWERHVTATEADVGRAGTATTLREIALGGPDTASRAQVIWQVKVKRLESDGMIPNGPFNTDSWPLWFRSNWADLLDQWQPQQRGRLKAKAGEAEAADDSPCVATPLARYRGLENQLYRVEIHRGGSIGDALPPTFVWSRENGSVLYGVASIADTAVRLDRGWRDARFAIAVGDTVELLDDRTLTSDSIGALRRVTAVDPDTLTIRLDSPVTPMIDASRRPLLRRWDHGPRAGQGGRAPLADDGALALSEDVWLSLEDGLSIQFVPFNADLHQRYRSGDYWLIPARVATGDVLWPRTDGAPDAVTPTGVAHHYAPLGIVTVGGGDGKVTVDTFPAHNAPGPLP